MQVCGGRFLACARIKLCWAAPYHSSTIAQLPAHIQVCGALTAASNQQSPDFLLQLCSFVTLT
jgi:hypothetical protein